MGMLALFLKSAVVVNTSRRGQEGKGQTEDAGRAILSLDDAWCGNSWHRCGGIVATTTRPIPALHCWEEAR
jgi:hypothetical protein